MRALKIICGIAILITALHFGHGVQHFYYHHGHDGMHGPALFAAMGAAILMALLSFIGGCLLIKG
jgi:hypothetical protein